MTFYRSIFIILICSSCYGSKTPSLEGKWNVENVTFKENDLLPHQRLQLKEELNSMIIDIKDDGVIIYSNFYRTGAHGNWNSNTKKDSLTLNYQYQKAVITDSYALQFQKEKMKLISTGFEGVKEVEITLRK